MAIGYCVRLRAAGADASTVASPLSPDDNGSRGSDVPAPALEPKPWLLAGY